MSEEITLTKEKLKEIIHHCVVQGHLMNMKSISNVDIKLFSENEYFKQIINECENPQHTNERDEK